MTNPDKKHPEWLLWLSEKSPVWFFIVPAICLGLLLLIAVYLDSRFQDLEIQLAETEDLLYSAPRKIPGTPVVLDASLARSGQTVYVPAYSHIYHNGGQPFLLETTLSIRNVDPLHGMTVTSVKYFNTSGTLIREYVETPISLSPLETVEFLSEEHDLDGGSGANFLVNWISDDEIVAPMIETIMVGTDKEHGLSFSRTGLPISTIENEAKESAPDAP